MTVIQGTV